MDIYVYFSMKKKNPQKTNVYKLKEWIMCCGLEKYKGKHVNLIPGCFKYAMQLL